MCQKIMEWPRTKSLQMGLAVGTEKAICKNLSSMAHNLFKKDITWFRAEAKRNWKVKVVQVKVNSRCLLPLPERHCPVLGKVGKQLNGEGKLESAWRRCNRLVNLMVYVTRIKADVNSPTHSSLT